MPGSYRLIHSLQYEYMLGQQDCFARAIVAGLLSHRSGTKLVSVAGRDSELLQKVQWLSALSTVLL
jgi:hypothetical protein